jgi:hypothetical protein
MQKVRVGSIEMEALFKDRLIVEMQRQTGVIISARSLKSSRFGLKGGVATLPIFIDPSSDRIAQIAWLNLGRPIAPVCKDSTNFGQVDYSENVVVSGVMTYSCIEGDIVRGIPPR